MSDLIFKEWTSGRLGGFGLGLVFHASLTNNEFVVTRLWKIPINQIDCLTSTQNIFGVKYLSVEHHAKNIPQRVLFVSKCWDEWYLAFEKLHIRTEDPYEVRNSKPFSIFSLPIPIKLFASICLLVAFGGLICAVIAFIKIIILKNG